MQVRNMKSGQILPILFLLKSAKAASPCGAQGNGNSRRDDDSDDGDDNSTSHHSHFPSSTSSCIASGTSTSLPQLGSHGVSRGAAAGIAVGIAAAVLLLSGLGLCCWVRRRRMIKMRHNVGTIEGTRTDRPESNSEVRLLNDVHPSPQSSGSSPLYVPITYPNAFSENDVAHAPRALTTGATTMRDLVRSASISSLPNPHDPDYNASTGLPLLRANHAERDLPPLPKFPNSSAARSAEDETPLLVELSRGPTSVSRRTASTTGTRMSLHDEVALYQKRLEAHHEKEIGASAAEEGFRIPVDPPPEYREAEDEQDSSTSPSTSRV
ncbi:hypothetical protein NM688_g6616 [Phlebia brevispora]|uniref:Uncharacterized protein n=1 Tax=Phlebia brevispora TaxID=194682 RepID=A0ACC1SEB2_9APHY|nr:hypothetical protein NM688_g6616 [Phlebia brevispora]